MTTYTPKDVITQLGQLVGEDARIINECQYLAALMVLRS